MKDVYIHGHKVLVPFLKSEELKTFPEISEDDISKLNETVEKFTAAKTYTERQKIMTDYFGSIDSRNAAGGFYRSILGMTLNLRRDVLNQKNIL